MSERTVVIDCAAERTPRYDASQAVVVIDVIRATTTAITSVASGRRCFAARGVEEAKAVACTLEHAILAGEVDGVMPEEFELRNSPAVVAAFPDVQRPLVLVSTSGTPLMSAFEPNQTYVAALRNYRAQSAYLAANHPHVALVGAGSRGTFREEDALCCAWVARLLIDAGHRPLGKTQMHVERWRDATPDAILESASVEYLRRSDQLDDLTFILEHVDDLDTVYAIDGREVVGVNGKR
ncbi:MAG: 2-phosphosulfolactate phosphatase [Gaiellaceae bacterium]|jgi:2-phosphosulfolactate phosphatase